MKIRIYKMSLAVLLVISMCFSLTGCKQINYNETVAVVGEDEVSLGVAVFLLRVNQLSYESYASIYGGRDIMYASDLYGEGNPFSEDLKSDVMDIVHEYYILKQHMDDYGVELTAEDEEAIAETAKQFMEDNDDNTISVMGASEEVVAEVLRLQAIHIKMDEAIKADTDRVVSDEEARQKGVSYVLVSTTDTIDEDGESVPRTDEEKDELKAQAEELLQAVKDGADFSETAEEMDFYVNEATYGENNSTLVTEVTDAADELAEGEYADLIETDDGYYILRFDSELDREATDAQKETIITERENELYTEIVDEWKEAVEIVIEASVWKKIDFKNPVTYYTPEEEETDETSVDETEVEDDSAEDETEAEAEEIPAEEEVQPEEENEAGAEEEAQTEDNNEEDDQQQESSEQE